MEMCMKKQNGKMPAIIPLCMMFVSALQFIGCSSAVQLTSAWKRTDIIIDGKQNDWQGDLYDLKKAKVTIGVRNDEKNLYLCFISTDKNVQRQIMSGGFTVWFDPTGGTDETYGIQFPVGHTMKGGGPSSGGNAGGAPPSMPENMNGGEMSSDNSGNDNSMPPMPPGNDTSMHAPPSFGGNNANSKMSSMFSSAQSEIKFLGPEKEDVQLSTMIELKTIKVQVGVTRQAFVYELQVPLQKTEDFPFTLAPTDAKNILGIEFKTETSNSSGGPGGEMGGPGGGGGMGGPGGGGGMGGPGGGGGMGGPGGGGGMGGPGGGGQGGRSDSNSSDPIEVWAKVTLAQK
jgi:hypothetical protein